ncbi:MAG: two-component system, NarL family, nitrate/nitrite response regulator NarL [Solirubrobacteraceae bacterium]|jgi:two-component system nitrate/nitrite response regulator NarL|nr:two-component system, NarL family, nitrate/nitrite response regulator NarL [Solirubrobacteraceae bacterium]MEA2245274.1 two-component system, NarL family, nitrate/nitrite response regulator NarL [Solirubrobacteraceae bacterium]
MTARVSVYVGEDHPIYLEGLVRALRQRPEFEVLGSSTDGRQALEEIRRLAPDVAILDENMPGLLGNEVMQAISRDGLATRVLMLSASVDSAVVFRAVANGVSAYLTKDSDRSAICDAVAAVARGQTVLAPQVQAGLAGEVRLREHESRPALSPREHEILERTAGGFSAPDIARELHISTATVKTHLRNIYEKLGVSERAAAVAEAMRRGLLE